MGGYYRQKELLPPPRHCYDAYRTRSDHKTLAIFEAADWPCRNRHERTATASAILLLVRQAHKGHVAPLEEWADDL